MFGCDRLVSQAGQVEAVRKLVPRDGATCRKAAAAGEPENPCMTRVVVLE